MAERLFVRSRQLRDFFARSKWSYVAVFLLAILVSGAAWLLAFAQFELDETTDYQTYYAPIVSNLLHGRGYTSGESEFPTGNPPGYPLILALLFRVAGFLHIGERAALTTFNIICMALSALSVFGLARLISGSRYAVIGPLVWMTYPFVLIMLGGPFTELPFVACLIAGVYLLLCGAGGEACPPPQQFITTSRQPLGLYFASGVVFGLAMLIRSAGSGLPVVSILWVLMGAQPWKAKAAAALSLGLGSLVAISPWMLWAYANTGQWVLTGTNARASVWDGLTFAVNKPYRVGEPLPDDVLRLMANINSRQAEAQTLSGVLAIALDELQAQPLAFAKLIALKALRSWYGTDSGRYESQTTLIQAVYLGLSAAASVILLRKRRARYVVAIWLFVVYFWGTTVAVLSILRYMVGAMGLLFPMFSALPMLLAARYPEQNPR